MLLGYGEDTTAVWTAVGPSYLVGEHMDWDAVAAMPDGRVGDGGQMELSRGEIERAQLKRLWLFNLRVSTHCVCPCSMSLELIVPLMLLKALRMNAIVAHLLE